MSNYKFKNFLIILGVGLLFSGFIHFLVVNANADEVKTDQRAKPTTADNAAKVVQKQLALDPAKRVSPVIRKNAKCIGVFPSVVKAGILVTAKRGNGLASCRIDEEGHWSEPAAFKLTGASVGIQAGVQSASIIMFFMTDKSSDKLKTGAISLGGKSGVSVAAGNVSGEIDTDKMLKTSVITYAKSKGLFAGVDLEGSGLAFATKTNKEVYGNEVTAEKLLTSNDNVPEKYRVFYNTLRNYAPFSQSMVMGGHENIPVNINNDELESIETENIKNVVVADSKDCECECN